MSFEKLMFEAGPYLAALACLIGVVLRFSSRPFSVTSLSSQFLESRGLFWGSVPWHYGVLVVLSGHFVAFLWPAGILTWNSIPSRLVVLEITAGAFGALSLFGVVALCVRRGWYAKIRAVTSPVDVLVLGLLVAQTLSGVLTAVFYRWGSSWYASAATPYLWSLCKLSPDSSYIQALPMLVKTHIAGAFILVAAIPYSRLIHVFSIPVTYLWRPPQLVVWNRRKS